MTSTPRMFAAIAGAFVAVAVAGSAHALATYGFQTITANGVGSPNILDAQISFTVTEPVAGQALLTFNNSGPDASSITDIYFDDPNSLIASILSLTGSGAGVNFSVGAAPPDLPSGNNVNFNVSAGLAADSDAPAQPNGVNPGESLGVLLDLTGANTAANLVNSLNASGVNAVNELRVGIHVQGFANGQSESAVNPEPASAALVGLGAMLMLGRRRNAA